jgi:adenine-specific DNA-methyltransferase
MASLFHNSQDSIHLLDPGAGVGSLTTAYINHVCQQSHRPRKVMVSAFEIDDKMAGRLGQGLAQCGQACHDLKIAFDGRVHRGDFIAAGVAMLEKNLFGERNERFDCVILNPPYRKIATNSEHRRLLSRVGIETSNLYAAFLALSARLLKPGGQLVAITPRSFCNGPYFKAFRRSFLSEMSIRRIHIFESRKTAFRESEVLQENLIFYAVKTSERSEKVIISSSLGPGEPSTVREVPFEKLVKSDDPDQFIHIVTDEKGDHASKLIGQLRHSLKDIGLSVSTGPVVDFRSRKWLRANPGPDTVPLVYPAHFRGGWVAWPKVAHRKASAYLLDDESKKWLVPSDIYVLTKRFSSKEEKRRIVASIFDPSRVPCQWVALENHVNYFHRGGKGLPMNLAKGLSAFLNSSIVDTFFRQFNGHTQVNASDLRSLKYPTAKELEKLGRAIGDIFTDQTELDELVERYFPNWCQRNGGAICP